MSNSDAAAAVSTSMLCVYPHEERPRSSSSSVGCADSHYSNRQRLDQIRKMNSGGRRDSQRTGVLPTNEMGSQPGPSE